VFLRFGICLVSADNLIGSLGVDFGAEILLPDSILRCGEKDACGTGLQEIDRKGEGVICWFVTGLIGEVILWGDSLETNLYEVGDPRGGVWRSGATRGRHVIRSPEWPTLWTSARLPAMPSVRLSGLSGMAFL